jgi:AcrR family transcriptional regulator
MDTRTRLLLKAEELFAERGIDAVSLREINRLAGQNNTSALHYHFGTREALIEAIFAFRMGPIDAQRHQMLDNMGTHINLRDLVAVILRPLAALLYESSGVNHYNRFVSEATRSRSLNINAMVGGKYDGGLLRTRELLDQQLEHIPGSIRRLRIVVVLQNSAYDLADIERAMSEAGADNRPFNLDRAIENLIDMFTGSLKEPVSKTTAQLLSGKPQAAA